jgi:signal transduction histidine kinase
VSALRVEDQRRRAGFAADDVLNNPPRRAELVALVELAARVCQTRMAAIVLTTETQHHLLAAAGFDRKPFVDALMSGAPPREGSPTVVVPDTRLDGRFTDERWAAGPLSLVRFYASHALTNRAGDRLGTLLVLDNVPGFLDVAQRSSLATIADRVVDLFELVVRTRELTTMLAEVDDIRSELERSNERLASFAGQVSHDLRTPLTSLMLSLSLIQEQVDAGESGPELDYLLSRAVNGSSRMVSLIDDVLEYAKLGGMLKSVEVNLWQVMQEVCTDLESELDGVDLEIGQLPTVMGDRDQLRAVLQNLVSNAAKYRHPERAPHITVTAKNVNRAWRVEVSDNGRGVMAEERDRVFEPLARIGDDVEGSGIGLYTCRRIVGAHGGAIGLDLSVDEGAKFWFELPA